MIDDSTNSGAGPGYPGCGPGDVYLGTRDIPGVGAKELSGHVFTIVAQTKFPVIVKRPLVDRELPSFIALILLSS